MAPHCSGSRKLRRDDSAGAIHWSRRHLGDHVGAIVVLLQHELDQPVARRKHRQPGAAVGGRRQPRRIARQMIDRDRLRLPAAVEGDQPVAPAFADDHAVAVGCKDAEREGDACRDLAERAAGRIDASTAIPRRPFASGRPPSRTALRSAEPWSATDAPSAAKASAVMQPIAGGKATVARRRSAARRCPGPTAMSPAGEAASAVTGESKFRRRTGWPPIDREQAIAAAGEQPAVGGSQIVRRGERCAVAAPRRARMLGRKAPSIGGMVTAWPRNRSRMGSKIMALPPNRRRCPVQFGIGAGQPVAADAVVEDAADDRDSPCARASR